MNHHVVAHQVAHALTGTRPFDIIHIFDFTHHALAVWMLVLSTRWARSGTSERLPLTADPQPAGADPQLAG